MGTTTVVFYLKMHGYFQENPLKELFPKEVVVIMNNGEEEVEALYKEEKAIVVRAVRKRQREFSSGRLCAREALKILGISNFPLISGEGRQPIWPQGVSGSISHAKGCCGVAVLKSKKRALIGLDIEESDRLTKDLWPLTFVKEELEWLKKRYGEGINGTKWASVIFSAKEAFFKYQYPLTGAWVGLKDGEVSVNEDGSFVLKLLKGIAPKLKKESLFKGKYIFFDKYVATGLCLLQAIDLA